MLSTYFSFFFFNDTATTEIYTLSLHDALPISGGGGTRFGECRSLSRARKPGRARTEDAGAPDRPPAAGPLTISCYARSEEHTSELQSQSNLVCRLLLEKKKKQKKHDQRTT